MHGREHVATVVRDHQLDHRRERAQPIGQRPQEHVDALAGRGADRDRADVVGDELLRLARRQVALVEHEQLGHRGGIDLGEHLAHRGDLTVGVGGAGVDDVHEVVGERGDLERALERLDETVRQAADEADGVGEQHRLAAGQREPPGRRVEGGEQPVLGEHAGVGEPVEQRRLAGVRVARRSRRWRDRCALAALALQVTGRGQRRAGPVRAW